MSSSKGKRETRDIGESSAKEDWPQSESRPSEVPKSAEVPEAKGSPLSETGSEDLSHLDEANVDSEGSPELIERSVTSQLRKRKRKMKSLRIKKTANVAPFNPAFSEDLQQLRYVECFPIEQLRSFSLDIFSLVQLMSKIVFASPYASFNCLSNSCYNEVLKTETHLSLCLSEVFVSFCKASSIMNPDFDVKAVASDPLQLDTIKMNSTFACSTSLVTMSPGVTKPED